MLLKWWNSREVVEAGTRLADYLRPQQGREFPTGREARPVGLSQRELESFFRLMTREVGPRRLNLFKRAKLLNAFKWRLRENGVRAIEADQLTQMMLMQLCAGNERSAALAHGRATDAARLSARQITSLLGQADVEFAAGRRREAAVSLRRVLQIDPDHALAHARLGAALCHLGEFGEAEQVLRRAVELDGQSSDAHFNLGALLYNRGEFAAAETALRRAAKLDPSNAEALANLGLTLGVRNRLAAAQQCFAKALVLKPRNATALCGLGWLAAAEGRFDDCERLYRDAVAADPHKLQAWALLAEIRRMTTADAAWLASVKQLITADIPPLAESDLRFAMGKYFDDLGNFASAFDQYKRANELRKSLMRPYDRRERSSFVDDAIRVYSADAIQRQAEGASPSTKPVFVIGMMRSGTSLIEQIIASHRSAAGAGELDFWSNAAKKHRDRLRLGVPDAALAKKLADEYLHALNGHAREALRVVDKATFNSDYLGLIHSVFPHARIIYARRHPVDTCLSCYFRQLALNFTLDLADLAHYYREHHRLMQHWRAVLPAGTLLEVPYAELVADQERWSRRMIEFIGLEWEPRCLEFQATQRPVLTASSWQVRQRIYSSSVGRWRKYRRFIRPLLELQELEPA